jgi:hypothetical protein
VGWFNNNRLWYPGFVDKKHDRSSLVGTIRASSIVFLASENIPSTTVPKQHSFPGQQGSAELAPTHLLLDFLSIYSMAVGRQVMSGQLLP